MKRLKPLKPCENCKLTLTRRGLCYLCKDAISVRRKDCRPAIRPSFLITVAYYVSVTVNAATLSEAIDKAQLDAKLSLVAKPPKGRVYDIILVK